MAHRFWSSEDEAKTFLESGEAALVFKHSSRCSISFMVRPEVEDWMAANPEADCFEVGVIEHRPVSNFVAQALGVKHESPQVILVKGGKAVWNTSHARITQAAIEEAWAAHVS